MVSEGVMKKQSYRLIYCSSVK